MRSLVRAERGLPRFHVGFQLPGGLELLKSMLHDVYGKAPYSAIKSLGGRQWHPRATRLGDAVLDAAG